MTVAELIAALQEMPQELRVVIDGYEDGLEDVERVTIAKILLDRNKSDYYWVHTKKCEGQASHVMRLLSTSRANSITPTEPTPAHHPESPAMTELSPAQAAIQAFNARYELCGPLEDGWHEVCLAAAVRALADQVVPDEGDRWARDLRGDAWTRWEERKFIRDELLSTAAELEGGA